MDQTAVYMDMNSNTTIDFVGVKHVDIVQAHHIDNGFSADPAARRDLITRIVVQAWDKKFVNFMSTITLIEASDLNSGIKLRNFKLAITFDFGQRREEVGDKQ
ncbi:hypothetical protein PInf_016258 [Phytophthora infestans]|nr:hypothetical protein PInf_016258 [Phytophthora infestans]